LNPPPFSSTPAAGEGQGKKVTKLWQNAPISSSEGRGDDLFSIYNLFNFNNLKKIEIGPDLKTIGIKIAIGGNLKEFYTIFFRSLMIDV
jgi:hypothetical protein